LTREEEKKYFKDILENCHDENMSNGTIGGSSILNGKNKADMSVKELSLCMKGKRKHGQSTSYSLKGNIKKDSGLGAVELSKMLERGLDRGYVTLIDDYNREKKDDWVK